MNNATYDSTAAGCDCHDCGVAAYTPQCPRRVLEKVQAEHARMAEAGAMLAIQAKWALRMMRQAKLPARLCADFEADINAFETAAKENPE